MFSTSEAMSPSGGYHEYSRRCLVHREEIMIHVGGYHEYIRGYHEYIRGYHEYMGDVQYIGGIP